MGRARSETGFDPTSDPTTAATPDHTRQRRRWGVKVRERADGRKEIRETIDGERRSFYARPPKR